MSQETTAMGYHYNFFTVNKPRKQANKQAGDKRPMPRQGGGGCDAAVQAWRQEQVWAGKGGRAEEEEREKGEVGVGRRQWLPISEA